MRRNINACKTFYFEYVPKMTQDEFDDHGKAEQPSHRVLKPLAVRPGRTASSVFDLVS